MNCLFCQIIDKEKNAYVVYEDDAVVAVLDILPRAAGHTLVLPRIHAATILDLDDASVAAVFCGVRTVTKLLERALTPDGFTIGINHGRVAGQAIEHLHIHIIPRFRDDGGSSIHGVVNNPSEESLEEICRKIVAKK